MKFKCLCAYDGTDFFGWQSQVGGNTVQDVIEHRLKQIFKKPVKIQSSGRTDSGVHANAQCFHFEASWDHSLENLLSAIRCNLPESIFIISIKKAKEDFNARYSSKSKQYIYQIYQGYAPPLKTRYFLSIKNKTLNIEEMQKASKQLIGTHNFIPFSAKSPADEMPIKTIYNIQITKKNNQIRIIVRGSGFLYKMVRTISDALIKVGLGKLTSGDIKNILQSQKRTTLISTAPAKGLIMDKVFY